MRRVHCQRGGPFVAPAEKRSGHCSAVFIKPELPVGKNCDVLRSISLLSSGSITELRIRAKVRLVIYARRSMTGLTNCTRVSRMLLNSIITLVEGRLVCAASERYLRQRFLMLEYSYENYLKFLNERIFYMIFSFAFIFDMFTRK